MFPIDLLDLPASSSGSSSTNEGPTLRQLLASPAYDPGLTLPLALGATDRGEPFVRDLTTLPHLLIAGAPESGVSSVMHAMLASLLYHATPRDLRLVLIDGARRRFVECDNNPHLLTPVVTQPGQGSNALAWAVGEMQRRYHAFAERGVRNIRQHNDDLSPAPGTAAASHGSAVHVPHLVFFIAELADLMLSARTRVEAAIVQLAQTGRAAGIHLLIFTRHLTVDVVTGMVKANMPARLALKLPTARDSRTVLDRSGAEQLLARGDMFFLPPTSQHCVFLRAPTVSDAELVRIADFLRQQERIAVNASVTEDPSDPVDDAADTDPLYPEAVRLVRAVGRVSISMLQQRFNIGFSRAARLLDSIRDEGLSG